MSTRHTPAPALAKLLALSDAAETLNAQVSRSEDAIRDARHRLTGSNTEQEYRDLTAALRQMTADLPALQKVLEYLSGRGLAIYLSPPGQRRGVVVTHGLYPPEELERVRQAHAQAPVSDDEAPPSRAPGPRLEPAWAAELAALRAEVETLRNAVQALANEVRDLKSALGA